MLMPGTVPTGATEGTLAPLDKTAAVRSFTLYAPDVYEQEKYQGWTILQSHLPRRGAGDGKHIAIGVSIIGNFFFPGAYLQRA